MFERITLRKGVLLFFGDKFFRADSAQRTHFRRRIALVNVAANFANPLHADSPFL